MPSATLTWPIVVVAVMGAVAIITIFVVAMRALCAERRFSYPSVYAAYLAFFSKALLGGDRPMPVFLTEDELAAVALGISDARRGAPLPAPEADVLARVQRLRKADQVA